MLDLRIALVIADKETGKEICTKMIQPAKLVQEFTFIQEITSWKVVDVFIANQYGMKVGE